MMCKRMIDAHKREAQAIEEARAKIADLKESFNAQINWLWAEL